MDASYPHHRDPQRFIHWLFDKLKDIPDIEWDTNAPIFHSTRDEWHARGFRRQPGSAQSPNTNGSTSPITPSRSSFSPPSRPGTPRQSSGESSIHANESVLARISTNSLQLERQYQLSRAVAKRSDPKGLYHLRAQKLLRLPPQNEREPQLTVILFEDPGWSTTLDLVNFGSNWWRLEPDTTDIPRFDAERSANNKNAVGTTHLPIFLDIAIGAAAAVEMLHTGKHVIHTELRGDSFHFNRITGTVRLTHLASGSKSVEDHLQNGTWSHLSRERGVEYKLNHIALEQTGRVAAAPDIRTDVYRLGIVFWNLLAGDLPFSGSPLQILQHVFSSDVPPITTRRYDVPDAISAVISKTLSKNQEDRYNSITGLKLDLIKIQQLLSDGDSEGLRNFVVGSRDTDSLFQLPCMQIGRETDRRSILNVIDRVAETRGNKRRRLAGPLPSATSDDASSSQRTGSVVDETSETASIPTKQNSNSSTMPSPATNRIDELKIVSTMSGNPNETIPSRTSSMNGGRGPGQAKTFGDSSASLTNHSISSDLAWRTMSGSMHSDGTSNTHRGSPKYRQKGSTEVVVVSGAAGLGKSSLVSSVLASARQRGYVAGARFDQVSSTPFDPCLRALSSVIQQIFSEPDVSTEFHDSFRHFVKHMWPLLSQMLGLPHWLLDKTHAGGGNANDRPASTSSFSMSRKPQTAQQRTADFFRHGTCAKSSRFIAVYLDVLRFLAERRFILLTLDDAQFADAESVHLLESLLAARVPIVTILTVRDDLESYPSLNNVLSNDKHAIITKVALKPLAEDQISEYVQATLKRDADYVFGLVAVLQERTGGNPFFLRQMLEDIYQTDCLWFSFDSSSWVYSLDRIFKHFTTSSYGRMSDQIKRRILGLSDTAISLLKWASCLGSLFHFSTVKALMGAHATGEQPQPESHRLNGKADLVRRSSQDAVRALQECIAAYVIEADEGDSQKFRWCHERYLHTASTLCTNIDEMHFEIAQIMVSGSDQQQYSEYCQAMHICQSVDLIRKRVSHRHLYRRALFRAAEQSTEAGGRAQALRYLSNCLLLLQKKHWDEELPDVDYQETLHILTRAAQAHFAQGQFEPTMGLLNTIFRNAHDAVDKVPAYILKSRISTGKGDHKAAFNVLKECLGQLGVQVLPTKWEECDSKFHRLCERLQTVDQAALFNRQLSDCRIITMRGNVLCDAIAAAFWSDPLLFYQLTLLEVELDIFQEPVSQAGLAYVHLAAVAVGRFDMIEFSVEKADLAHELLRKYQHVDPYTYGRGMTLHAILVGHLVQPIDALQYQLNQGLEYSLSAGDTTMALINIGFNASVQIWSSADLADVENFCNYGAEEIKRWQEDSRGGMFITAARQFARAMQGKTRTDIPHEVLDDREHNSSEYTDFIKSKSVHLEKNMMTYKTCAILAQYLFGHYNAVLETSGPLMAHLWEFWSSRFVLMIPFYRALAQFALLHENALSVGEPCKTAIEDARKILHRLESWSVANDANYAVYISLLRALIAEAEEKYGTAVQEFEAAQDAAELNSLHMDYALATELSAEFLVRRGAKRLARGAILESTASYRRVSAFAKASQLQEKYEYLLRCCAPLHAVDANTQTNSDEFPPAPPTANDLGEIEIGRTDAATTPVAGHASKGSGSQQSLSLDSTALGLDVLDLQNILNSSQVLASELNFDKLVDSITQIVQDGTNAGVVGLVQADEDAGWIVRSFTDSRSGVTKKDMALQDIKNAAGISLVMSAVRFRETIFEPDVYNQTRFNFSQQDLSHFQDLKAVIMQPIFRGDREVIGVIFCHGRAFTQRNANFLRMLGTTFSSALTNARLFKEVERVSANNAVMVEAQRHALEKARQSEQKAKEAEAEAMRNVKITEEAVKAKSAFLANVSHELRTPLNGVIGMSELLKGTSLSSEQDSYADSIRVCADTLLTVINDILDFSKLEAGKMQMFSVELSLFETIHEVVRALSFSNKEKDVETITKLDVDRKALVLGDPVRLHQILMNLMSNAYKFTPRGQVVVAAGIDHEDENSMIATMSVADTGVGIPEEQQRKLFLPFSQADSSTARSYGGTGLGLSICKQIIEKVMKGKIWLESEVGVGTKVSFTLTFSKAAKHKKLMNGSDLKTTVSERIDINDPMNLYSPSEKERERDQQRNLDSGANSPVDLSKVPVGELRVLIAEDNMVNQKIAIGYAKKLGYKHAAFPDGRQAVDALEKASTEGNPFHIVLMDCQMPILDGYDATQEIRRSKDEKVKNVLIIAMTASAIRGDRERCLDSGMNSYLAKPVRQNVLKRMIDRWIEAPRAAAHEAVEEVRALSENGAVERGDKIANGTANGTS